MSAHSTAAGLQAMLEAAVGKMSRADAKSNAVRIALDRAKRGLPEKEPTPDDWECLLRQAADDIKQGGKDKRIDALARVACEVLAMFEVGYIRSVPLPDGSAARDDAAM